MRAWIKRVRAMDHQEFANRCSGWQAILIGCGVILGGLWSGYLFWALQQQDNVALNMLQSRHQLQALQLANEKATDEARRAFGLVTLATQPVKAERDGSCYLQVNATVSNAGNREIRLWFEGENFHPPLNVAQVSLDTLNEIGFTSSVHASVLSFTPEGDTIMPMEQSSLLPGESSTYPFLVRLPRDGVYLVQFRVPVDTAKADSDSVAPKPDSIWYWAARSYVPGCSSTTGSKAEPTREARPAVSPPDRK